MTGGTSLGTAMASFLVHQIGMISIEDGLKSRDSVRVEGPPSADRASPRRSMKEGVWP